MSSYSFPKNLTAFTIDENNTVVEVRVISTSGISGIAVVEMPNGNIENILFEHLFKDVESALAFLDGKESRDSKKFYNNILYGEGGNND
ncbi:hypothetical protein [Butyrivibrio hungatei]|uniref:Uncharacterized protein n=1 Tax=Butyrivibrio hungatei TaxID=185008 RepID=A0A1D9P5L4_9FIRM|nr:hypothetical protein [Butyrivibrio hungatei]AOZ97878.1 hypothetical protein bhn_II079 [Butyrivibrio hungatei]